MIKLICDVCGEEIEKRSDRFVFSAQDGWRVDLHVYRGQVSIPFGELCETHALELIKATLAPVLFSGMKEKRRRGRPVKK